MNRRNRSFWRIFLAVFGIVIVAVLLLLALSNRPALSLINGPFRFIFSGDSTLPRSILFRAMARETQKLPLSMNAETAIENGIGTIMHGSISPETGTLLNAFLAEVSEGKTAQIIFTVFTAEGDPIYMNVLFDRVRFVAVIDRTRDRSRAENEMYHALLYDYLKFLNDPETGNTFVVLTNDSGLTFEQLREAQIGSDMESIDSFHLFTISSSGIKDLHRDCSPKFLSI